jgi:hypothetical protein
MLPQSLKVSAIFSNLEHRRIMFSSSRLHRVISRLALQATIHVLLHLRHLGQMLISLIRMPNLRRIGDHLDLVMVLLDSLFQL